MRYLGIDYGTKRIGVAVSDESLSIAFPLEVLENKEDLFSNLKKICEKNEISVIIVGESKNFLQKDNEIMKDILPFVDNLKKETGLSVILHPEFMTSIEAERIQGHNDMHDASAAALILNSYLEAKKNLSE